ncbi:RNA-directed DNA polymerase, eukaryota [Tanacetum coccineum]
MYKLQGRRPPSYRFAFSTFATSAIFHKIPPQKFHESHSKLITQTTPPVTATTPSHLTTNLVITTALITLLSRRCYSPVIDPPLPSPLHKVEEVQFYLFRNGIDLSYTNWTRHGEKDEPSIRAPEPINATTEFVDDTDFASDIPTDGPATVEMVNATKDNFDEDDLVKFQELLLDAEKPLYEGCPDFTKLSAIVKLLNLKGKYRAFDKFFTELLGLIKKMLPTDSQAWRTIDEKFLKIAEDPRNLRLGISADGVDVNTGNRHHSGYPGNDINVFLEPLVDDLYTLFKTGVDTYDVSTKDNFNQHAVVLWTINDYPALGTLCGCSYSGFKGCVVCGKDANRVRLSTSSKQKKNVAESLVGTLLHVSGKMKDGVNTRLDLAELGVKPELFAMQEEDKTTLPPAGYTLTNAEKDTFCETLHNIRVPQGGLKPSWKQNTRVTISISGGMHNKNLLLSGYVKELREKLAISKESVSDNFYQNSGVSVEATDLHISKEVATTRQAFYYGVLQEIWVLDYRFRQIPLFKCDWVMVV